MSDADGDKEIFVMNADGTNPQQLTSNDFDDAWIAWSPDGSKIAFSSNRAGNYDIFVMNADGSNQTTITTNPSLERAPDWSPDGTKLLYTAKYASNFQIYVVTLANGTKSNLSSNSHNDQAAAWSSEVNKIVFRSDRDGDTEIFVMNADGSNQTKLTNNTSDDLGPVWSSDSSAILFNSNRDGNDEIYIMNPNGTNQTRLTNNPAREFDMSLFNGNIPGFPSITPQPTITPSPSPTQTAGPTNTQTPGNPADVDNNGSVNLADVQAVIANFDRTQFSIRDPQPDGKITIFDFSIVAQALYAQNPSATPTTGPSPTSGPTPTAGTTPSPTPPPPTPLAIPGEIRLMEWNEIATQNRSGFLEYKPAPEFAQGNWITPENYAEGKLYFRAKVNGIPVNQPGMKLGFCLWQGENNTSSWGEECASSEPVAGLSGTDVQWSRNMNDLNPIGGVANSIEWDVRRWKYGIIVRNVNNLANLETSEGKPVSAKSGMNWNGEDPTHWYPLDIRFTVVLVKKNQTFSGWDNYGWN